jgi:hypothetical protein
MCMSARVYKTHLRPCLPLTRLFSVPSSVTVAVSVSGFVCTQSPCFSVSFVRVLSLAFPQSLRVPEMSTKIYVGSVGLCSVFPSLRARPVVGACQTDVCPFFVHSNLSWNTTDEILRDVSLNPCYSLRRSLFLLSKKKNNILILIFSPTFGMIGLLPIWKCSRRAYSMPLHE